MSTSPRKPRVFSGMRPSGTATIGNYLGAIRNWVAQQAEYDNLFCIVDLHALDTLTDPNEMRDNIHGLAATMFAAGLDPEIAPLFAQSDVPQHAELTWTLSAVTQFGELSRMTQFKDKTAGKSDAAINSSMFFYPVLMASDILLYDSDLVPVGDDQRQHVELTRDIANRFNARYGETFVVPKADIKEVGARIMSLQEPTKKMSKTDPNVNSFIALSDESDVIKRKIKRAVTDSDARVAASPDKPAVSNLMQIYGILADMSLSEVEDHFAGKGYGPFKAELTDLLVESLAPIHENLRMFAANPDEVTRRLEDGAAKARVLAEAKMSDVNRKTGVGGKLHR
ncbi:MAG: tryptophan--tRNA ligase [Thermomicrobiales bacterium]|nr:tryptophan--tRNA ligase [Thermomicrobiales bacterium]MCO5219339.1 tryptophan--tRNA ligase [Thermomicrobiales bacterium]MCO5229177.1 tryptophan--tRNA ligase [Thermomicrobiales bacterium]